MNPHDDRHEDSRDALKHSPLCVLVVDDDPDTARVLMKILASAGFISHAAGSYREAMHVAAESPPDVLVSDIGLPDKDGWRLLQILRTANPGLMALAVSGLHTDEDDLARSRAAGFAEHMLKPVQPHLLLEAIGRLSVALSAPAPTRSAHSR